MGTNAGHRGLEVGRAHFSHIPCWASTLLRSTHAAAADASATAADADADADTDADAIAAGCQRKRKLPHTHTHTHKFFFVASLLSPSLHPSPILLPISESLKCPCCLPSSPNPPPSLLSPPGRGYACHLRHGQLASSVFGLLATAT